MQKILIVGAGKGGLAILGMLQQTSQIIAVIDRNANAPGIRRAKELGIPTGANWQDFLTDTIDLVIEVTGDIEVFKSINEARGKDTIVVPGGVAYMISTLMEEREELIHQLKNETYKHDLIFNSSGDGMIVVNAAAEVTLFNRSAAKIIGISPEEVIGKHIHDVIPSSRLPYIMKTKRIETNQELTLENELKVITTRIPMIDEKARVIGAFAVFKEITEVVRLAGEITNLKEIQTMLEAIIQSSDEAISVVDENGRGIMINRAYSRITGLTEEEVIGKPATADIYEGESMHMKVLETRRPVRGVAMRVGPNRKEVIVNVAPIIVDGKLKGSVGVIHDMSEIQSLNRELIKARQIIRTLEAKYTFEDIIGNSEEMNLAIEQARLGAKTPATVLLRGESGTGKELFAHAIHNESDRKFNKFIRVNCAAITESLLESELFGYEEGAFSGAKRGGKRGFFEEANNGSIFLDEIGELPANTQAKLLRVLQEKEIVRVGGTKAIPINVRVIAATNINLEKAIANGTFREDLYYRLNRMPIHIPPLRMRKEDIPLLCDRLIHKINQDYGRNIEKVSPSATRKLLSYSWPGNVRELENVLGRAIIFMNYHELEIQEYHLPEFVGGQIEINQAASTDSIQVETLANQLHEYEMNIIKDTLGKVNGNKTLAAKCLGISVRSLYYKLEKFGYE
ncbi:sigma 54-interacting transcriptional regulator [Mesobacillus maritimus]|uniref:Sigma 54-interacting transcriptional regulator n=1 Tax=Mesobacillus maritimus TaxID=1643336 RepID=A0ABS7K2G2_9BACI|nr:sigma 54-interacting transcriptional regulator [Mesobacillus maritimus]MBY0096441.1 sigma 54-interacting transcriptional regulator [Mesobacillus maritimus]